MKTLTWSSFRFILSLSFRDWSSKEVIILLALLLTSIGGYIAFPLFFISRPNVLIGVVLFPFALFCNGKQRINYFYLVFMLACASIALLYSLRVFYFFTITFFVLFLIELWSGKVNPLILFLIVFMSPFFKQIAVIMGFPIRLQLSSWAGELLRVAGFEIQVQGNMMILDGAHFAVDEACMGLNMLVFAMLIGVVALIHQYRSQQLQLTFWKVAAFFVIVFFLEIISNLLRILVLVVFKIGQQNPMHEITGILCFVIYVVVPVYFISSWFVRQGGKPLVFDVYKITPTRFTLLSIIVLSTGMLLVGVHVKEGKEKPAMVHATVSLPGFQSTHINDGISKLYNETTLLYVKPIPDFFSGEHTPLMCWRGSGFQFEGIQKRIVYGSEIYVGKLVKPGDSLFIAWWYSNGKVQTIDQTDWRMRMFKGEDRFCLVSVTTKSEADLYTSLEQIIQQKQLHLSNISD